MKQLTGTEKQIRWAEDIRSGIVNMYEGALAHIDYELTDDGLSEEEIEAFTQRRERYVREFAEILDSKTSAAWWIDHRIAPVTRGPMDNELAYHLDCSARFDTFIRRAARKW